MPATADERRCGHAMGLAPDITELKNPYASGTKWKASGATQPEPYTQFKPNRNRRDPMFEKSWRDKVYEQDPRLARAAAERAASQAKLEAEIAAQGLKILRMQEERVAMVARDQLRFQRALSAGRQRREQRRFDADTAYNAVKNQPDRLVETRSPPIMNVCGQLDGSTVGWWAPRPESAPPANRGEWKAPFAQMNKAPTRALPSV